MQREKEKHYCDLHSSILESSRQGLRSNVATLYIVALTMLILCHSEELMQIVFHTLAYSSLHIV